MSRWVTGQTPILPEPGGSVHSPRGATYLLGDLMGEGSFGAVFDCLGPFDQPFALKMLRPGTRPYSEARAEWQQEAERLYRLRHPNVVYVFDYFEAQGLFYLVLERCDHSLSDMLSRPFTDRLVVDLSRQILFALQYLSDSEIIHNDLHAGNILVQQGDHLTLKLSDLGIAQELSGQHAVRPALVQHRIMAPELVAGGYTTKQSDLYQLGLLMYEMHTGEYPLDTAQGYDAMLQQIKEGVPRLKAEALGTPIGNIVSVLLRRNEQYRYTSPAQVWEDLRRLDVWADVARPASKTLPPEAVIAPKA
ncbi:MAG TPA: serine/threonine-protein kinase [Polyangiaceae bacterium]|nr:serine/threonine-protein kinase [Polyangiaceae bacterium]